MFMRRKNHKASERLEAAIATGRADTADDAEMLAVIEAIKPGPLPSSLTDLSIHRAVKRQLELERREAVGLIPDRVTAVHVHTSAVSVPGALGNVTGDLYDAIEPITPERARLAAQALERVLDKLRTRTT